MNTSLSWIKAYVPDLDVTAQEYTDAMTLSGTKVENYEEMDADLDKIVVGQIDKIEKHPDADEAELKNYLPGMDPWSAENALQVDEVILPEETRERLTTALRALS